MHWYTLLFNTAAVITVVFLFIFLYFRHSFRYWKKHNVAYVEPSFPFGNLRDLFLQKNVFGEIISQLYGEMKKSGEKFMGLYSFAEPVLIPIDTELIKNIMTRDFQHFVDRGLPVNEKDDPLSTHMFNLSGLKWRNLRSKLSPTFTSGKMKMMFPILVAVTEKLVEVLDELAKKSEPVDIKDVMARFTTDIIGSCAFGLENNSLTDADNELRKYGRRFFQVLTLRDLTVKAFRVASPKLCNLLKIKVAPPEFDSFFKNLITQVVDYREKNIVDRKDFMYLLLQLKNHGKLLDDETEFKENIKTETHEPGTNLTMNEIMAQCFAFFVAGFETSSSTSTFVFYELVKNPEIQEKLREEIHGVLKSHNGKFTYESLLEMTYLDQVVSETLRKYPILPVLLRECTLDYKIPGSSYTIRKGQKVFIPVRGLQHDPEFYPNPTRFDPERFSEKNKSTRDPYTYLPFGEGPRFCIGKRFGLMQTKLGVATIVKNYRVSLNPKSEGKLKYDPKSALIMQFKDTLYLDVVKV